MSYNPALPPAEQAFVNTLRWYYWGVILATIMYGVTVAQFVTYLRKNEDKTVLRVFVCFVFLLDTAATFLGSGQGDRYFIEQYGDFPFLLKLTSPLIEESIVTIIQTFCVQLFFIYQVSIVNKKYPIIIALCVIFSLGALSMGLAYMATVILNPDAAVLDRGLVFYLIAGSASCDVATDLLSTGIMTLTLFRSRTGFKNSDSLINRLLMYIINRGLLVTGAQLFFLILYVNLPLGQQWLFFHLILTKLYANTMLAMLNGRRFIAEGSSKGASSLPVSGGVPSVSQYSNRPVPLASMKDARQRTGEGIEFASLEDDMSETHKPEFP